MTLHTKQVPHLDDFSDGKTSPMITREPAVGEQDLLRGPKGTASGTGFLFDVISTSQYNQPTMVAVHMNLVRVLKAQTP